MRHSGQRRPLPAAAKSGAGRPVPAVERLGVRVPARISVMGITVPSPAKRDTVESLEDLVVPAAKAAGPDLDGRQLAGPERFGLMLCTTPADFTGLMAAKVHRDGSTLQKTSRKTTAAGHAVPACRLRRILQNHGLPTIAELHGFLVACGVPANLVPTWHHTLTRLTIAGLRAQQRTDTEAERKPAAKLIAKKLVRFLTSPEAKVGLMAGAATTAVAAVIVR
ncbi:hypothetical protein [Kitasatospora sp. KL5]|uniref:hypothetical protein n=1 Tax=Kitasatospora sp. KL5 TaxID=3425125 RepID=UPI003D6F3B05